MKISQGGEGFHDGKLLMRTTKLGFKYPDAKAFTFKDVSLEVEVVLILHFLDEMEPENLLSLKTLTGDLTPTEGAVTWAMGTYDPTSRVPEKPVTFVF